jgi:hypothetical protein
VTTAHYPDNDRIMDSIRAAAAMPAADFDRANRIAAIHAFADWLVDHPEAPVPTSIVAEHHITERDEVDEYTRVMGALQVMQHIGIRPYEGDHTVQGDLDLCAPATHGLYVIYRVIGHKERQPKRRYIP